MQHWDVSEEVLLSNYLINQVCDRASGLLDAECLHNMPSDTYFIGSLRPVSEDDENTPRYLRDLRNKLSPMAFGAEFRVLAPNHLITVDIQVTWNCYYRVFPFYQQQRMHQLREVIAADTTAALSAEEDADSVEPDDEVVDTAEADIDVNVEDALYPNSDEDEFTPPPVPPKPTRRKGSSVPKDSFAMRFKKIDCYAKGRITLRFDGDGTRWSDDCRDLQSAIDAEMKRAQEIVRNDPKTLRSAGNAEDEVRVPADRLVDEATYVAFCSSLRNAIIPTWQWECKAESSSTTNEVVLLFTFTNISPIPTKSKNIEPYLFAARAAFRLLDGMVIPFELELVPRGFRYDRRMLGRGFNCSVEVDQEQALFVTSNTPTHTQGRYSTRTQPTALFSNLVDDPVSVLRDILAAMQANLEEWDEAERDYIGQFPDWDNVYAPEFERDKQLYLNEIARFSRGIDFIEQMPDVQLAFKLTNQTFLNAGTARGTAIQKTKTAWRLFQIVFVVTQIPGIAALADPGISDVSERSIVDIIYFPTGGGKTEAYLSVIVFHCFFDRLRGKAAGVTAWTRFPLRLLTLQQTQRVADVIGMAELIRRKQSDTRLNGAGVAGFAVGYFAGKGATPNELTEPTSNQTLNPDWSKALDNRQRQKWKMVNTCPSCGTSSIHLEFDEQHVRIFHHCTNRSCQFPDGKIPVYVIDNEIYRYLPCVIVGTVDKLASIGNQRKLALVFGQADGICPKHGYYKGECCQKGCSEQLRSSVPQGLSGPTLFVQDELHLLEEGFGTFDSHYETFAQELLRLAGQKLPLKIIASSATIEAFDRQVEHLYGRTREQARIFPGTGVSLHRSFYAETEEQPQRIFIGIIPHNKTLLNAIQELIQYYHEVIQDLQRLTDVDTNPFNGNIVPGTAAWASLVDYYSTSLTYFISNRDLNSIRTDLDTVVSDNLQKRGKAPLEIAELTGGTGTEEVTRILEQLETRLPLPGSAPTAVLATKMVSHGVDVDRFNTMFFYGMPRQNAEYIQSSSRVGRSHVGIVFNCLSPARERDQSHYAYFSKFHEFLGRLVEPVAINRWSKFSIRHTLPGLFMGILLQRLANRPGITKPGQYYLLSFIRKEISSGRLGAQDFIPLLEAAYQVQNPTTVGEQTFGAEIRGRIPIFIDQILQSSNQHTFVSEALKPYGPMNSLRDVDEELPIELDHVGREWASTSGRRT